MAELAWRDRLRVEQVRALEQQDALGAGAGADAGAAPGADAVAALTPDSAPEAAGFPERLSRRAETMLAGLGNTVDPDRMARWHQRVLWAGTLALFAVGALATVQSVSAEGQRINVYWLLILILGMPLVSLLLWALAVLLRPQAFTGLAGVAWQSLLSRVGRLAGRQAALDRAWLEVFGGGTAGRWHLAALTNRAWVAYLLGGWLALLLLLMARQLDFFWGTTLLSEHDFIALTGLLAKPLAALGWDAPTPELVGASRYGTQPARAAEARQTWAIFLLGSIFLYGLLPRLALWLFCAQRSRQARRRYELPLHLPYYLMLERQLQPQASEAEVVDPDQAGLEPDPAAVDWVSRSALPEAALWVPVEVADPASTAVNGDLLEPVVDASSRDRAVAAIARVHRPVILLVDGQRIADRGTRRLLQVLMEAAGGPDRTYLALAGTPATLPPRRLDQWQRLGAGLGLGAGRLALLDAPGEGP